MFFAQTDKAPEISTFSKILNSYIHGEKKFEGIVHDVLSVAIGYAKGEKQLADIRSDFFTIVVFLDKRCRDFLSGLSVDKMSQDQFQEVANSLNRQEPIF